MIAPSRLNRMFAPQSIAILGASEDFNKINGRPLKFLIDKGYTGRIFPINPKYESLAGLACYPELAAVPQAVDLAIVALPASAVLAAIRTCAASGAGGAVVFSSGFAEMGDRGRALEDELRAAVAESAFAVCGPNTLGFMNTFDNVMATFSQAADGPVEPGPIGFVTQSGAFGTAIFALARERGLSFGYFINTGNEAGLTFADILEYVICDPRVRVAAGYIEGLKDGARLLEVADAALDRAKPIVIVKVGRSNAGARAALSHTGSLAGSDRVYDDVFRQKGIIRAAQEEELLDILAGFSQCPLPNGRNVALVTQSGGAGVLMADRADELGLSVPELSAQTKAELSRVVPAFGSLKNPVDITAQFVADPDLLRSSLEIVLRDPQIDAAIFYLGLMDRFADRVVENLKAAKATTSKPLLVAWVAAPALAREALRESGICMLPSATRAVTVLKALVDYAQALRDHRAAPPRTVRAHSPAPRISAPAGGVAQRPLGSAQTFALLAEYGIGVAPWAVSRTKEETIAAAARLGFPLAIKVESTDIPHKSDAGALRLNVQTVQEAAAAHDAVIAAALAHTPEASIDGVLVQRMVEGGDEVIVGLHRDPTFGPVVMAGLGGVFVEILNDVAFRSVPLTRSAARDMIAQLKGRAVLEGARGRPKADSEALVDVLLRLSDLAQSCGETLVGLDINPLKVLAAGHGAVAVDALAIGAGALRSP